MSLEACRDKTHETAYILFTVPSINFLSNHKRQDGLSSSGIIDEFPDVVSVLAESPDGHLVKAGEGEESRDGRVSHGREANPGQNLVRVIGTGHETE